jgi:catalase
MSIGSGITIVIIDCKDKEKNKKKRGEIKFFFLTLQKSNHMAIAIKNIPVLTGKDAEYFNDMIESVKNAPVTHVSESMIKAIKGMAERSKKYVIRK